MKSTRSVAAVTAALLALTACASDAEDGADGDTAADEAGGAFPRTVEVPGSAAGEVEIEAEPQRVAALSADAAGAVADLVGADRLVAVPANSQAPHVTRNADDLAGVEHTLPPGADADPEQVLSWDPDLVVVTARHDSEDDAEELLTQADLPVLAIHNGWASLDALSENITLLGEALGAEDRAEELTAEIADRSNAVATAAGEPDDDAPRVLVLSNQADQPFVNADSVVTADLLHRAGAVNAAGEAGVEQTRPVDPEQVVAMDPDAVLLVDVAGTGEEDFADLLDAPAVAALDAVEEEHVRVMPAAEVYASAGMGLLDGLENIAEWLEELR